MNYQDRILYAMQYLHGNKASARLYVRAMALVWNFHPYGRQTQAKYDGKREPLSANMRNVVNLMGSGKVTRRQWAVLMQSMFKEEGTHDMLKTPYHTLCEKLGLDMDEPAFSGGISDALVANNAS